MHTRFQTIARWITYVLFLFPLTALGQIDNTNYTLTNPLGNCNDLSCPLNAFITFLYWVGPPIAVIMILVGAYQILTAGSDPKKVADGKKAITYAVVGLIIILIGGGIESLIKDLLSKAQ